MYFVFAVVQHKTVQSAWKFPVRIWLKPNPKQSRILQIVLEPLFLSNLTLPDWQTKNFSIIIEL